MFPDFNCDFLEEKLIIKFVNLYNDSHVFCVKIDIKMEKCHKNLAGFLAFFSSLILRVSSDSVFKVLSFVTWYGKLGLFGLSLS